MTETNLPHRPPSTVTMRVRMRSVGLFAELPEQGDVDAFRARDLAES